MQMSEEVFERQLQDKRKGNTTMLSNDALERAASCLKTLAQRERLRMVEHLLAGEYSVQELADICGISQHLASTHLAKMLHCGLLRVERRGRQAFYKVNEPALASIMQCVQHRFGVSEADGKDVALKA